MRNIERRLQRISNDELVQIITGNIKAKVRDINSE